MRDGLAGSMTGVGPDRGMEGRLLRLQIWYRRSPGVQPQPRVADLDLLTMLQGMLLDLLAGDERPADALQVGQEIASLAPQLAMEAAYGPVASRVSVFSPRPIESVVPSTRLKTRPCSGPATTRR